MSKRVAILGSTGSIGKSALEVIESLSGDFQVVALTAHSSVELFCQQVRHFKPRWAALTNLPAAQQCQRLIADTGCQFLAGADSLADIASSADVDIVLCAVVGAAGLPAVMAAVQAGKTVAIANKEPLVMAGQLLTETARKTGATILPVDSEHSAVFQAMQAGKRHEVRRVILTASGGPFRTASIEQMKCATIEQALAHPTWSMGPKITVDSASMMNKALEIIEAVWLFGLQPSQVEALIHPESIVHSLVEFVDGSVIAQLGAPDMRLPIQYALTYPNRLPCCSRRLDFERLSRLTFEKPDLDKFCALRLGYQALAMGGTAPAVLNAANEQAVEAFLTGRIAFGQITDLIGDILKSHQPIPNPTLQQILYADQQARHRAQEWLSRHSASTCAATVS